MVNRTRGKAFSSITRGGYLVYRYLLQKEHRRTTSYLRSTCGGPKTHQEGETMNTTVMVSNCSNCPLFIYGTGGPGRDPDECGHPKFGVPHKCYTGIISNEDIKNSVIPTWCPLREEELTQTIKLTEYTLTDGSTIRICKTCSYPLCIVQTWPVRGGLQNVSHFQDGKPLLSNDYDKEQFKQLMEKL